MGRLRVLYLSSWPIGAHGEGAASFVYEQVAALGKVVDACYVQHGFSDALSWVRKRASGRDVQPISDLWPHDVRAACITTPRLPPRFTGRDLLTDVWKAGATVAGRVVQSMGRIDLIHAHVVLPAGLLGAAIAKALGVPLIVQEHSAPFSMHTDTAVKRKAVALALGSAQCVCAVGQMLAQEVNTEFKSLPPVVVFPNLVRTTLFKAEPMPVDRTALRLVTVSSLERRKGLDILLQAVRLVQDSGQAVQLRIVGTGSLRASLEPQLIRCGQDPATVLAGQLTRQQVAHEFENAHVYVCSSRAESFGIAAAEALSVGRPVVTTRCGGPESFVGETCGEVVAPDDPREMAAAILRTWNRLDDFEPICLHAMIDARFGSDAFCDRMLALYDQTVGARAAA